MEEISASMERVYRFWGSVLVVALVVVCVSMLGGCWITQSYKLDAIRAGFKFEEDIGPGDWRAVPPPTPSGNVRGSGAGGE